MEILEYVSDDERNDLEHEVSARHAVDKERRNDGSTHPREDQERRRKDLGDSLSVEIYLAFKSILDRS
jgi:hypothetical protein